MMQQRILRRPNTAPSSLRLGLYDYVALDEQTGTRKSLVVGQTFPEVGGAVSAVSGCNYRLAANFVRTDERVLKADSTTWANPADQSFTWVIAFKVATFGTEYNDLLNSQVAGGYGIWFIVRQSNQIVTGFNSPTGVTNLLHGTSDGVTAGKWHFLRAWYDKENGEVGNQLDERTPYTGALTGGFQNTNPAFAGVEIGGDAGGGRYYFDGAIGPVIMWQRVISAGEWSWLRQRGRLRRLEEL